MQVMAAPRAGSRGPRGRGTAEIYPENEPVTRTRNPLSALPAGHLSPWEGTGPLAAPTDHAAVPVHWVQASRARTAHGCLLGLQPMCPGRSLLSSSTQRPHLALLSGLVSSSEWAPHPRVLAVQGG